MSATLLIRVPTLEPVQQGSKTMIGIGRPCYTCKRKRMILVDAADVSNKSTRDRLKKYRQAIASAASDAARVQGWATATGGVDLEVELVYRRPETHLKVNGTLRKGKPIHKTSKPDLDKLLRAINDALSQAQVFEDDSQVVSVKISKRYADAHEVHGVEIWVQESATGLAGLLAGSAP